MTLGDQQIGTVCKDYYRDRAFCRNDNGDINLWKVHNLFTNAAKSTYIDQFLERSVRASQVVESIRDHLLQKRSSWYLN
ncbi:MAG TPA: DUF3871 family protein [Puia sp.]|nr:DUF3871 family protein [Puia sp.]